MAALAMVWIVLIVFLGLFIYLLHGISKPQRISYPKISNNSLEEGSSSLFSQFTPNLSLFLPTTKSSKTTHLHHLHSIKAKRRQVSDSFLFQRAAKSITPDTNKLKKLIRTHQLAKRSRKVSTSQKNVQSIQKVPAKTSASKNTKTTP